MNNLLKIDFGSGYNPKKGFKTCDFTENPMLDFQVKNYKIYQDLNIELKENSVSEFYIRNTVHHIPNLDKLFKMLFKYLKKNGKITIIECKKEFYNQNVFLDTLWYRYIIPRNEVWFSKIYRDYCKIAISNNFKIINNKVFNEKEQYIFLK